MRVIQSWQTHQASFFLKLVCSFGACLEWEARRCDLSGFMVFSASGFDKVSDGSLSPQMHKSWFLYGGRGASRPVTRLNQPRFLRAVSRSCDASARTRQWLKECSRSSGVSGWFFVLLHMLMTFTSSTEHSPFLLMFSCRWTKLTWETVQRCINRPCQWRM